MDADKCNSAHYYGFYIGSPAFVRRVTGLTSFLSSNVNTAIENNPDTYVQGNSHITGDSAYRLAKFMMTPFRDNGI